jgi:hypothetical protein
VDELVLRPLFAPSGVLVRKHCFDTAGFFDSQLRNAEDYDMWIRIACRFPVVKLDVPLWWYRVHGANKSHVPARQEAAALKVLGKAFGKTSPLRWRFLLKQKAYSYAAYAAALNYSSIGLERLSLARLLVSFLRWPLPYHRREVTRRLARPKKLVISLLRVLHVVERVVPRMSSHAPSPPLQPVPQPQPVHEGTE